MKKWSLVCLTCLLVFCLTFATAEEENPILFRNIPWGANFETAKAAFPDKVRWCDVNDDSAYNVEYMVYDGAETRYTGNVSEYKYTQSSSLEEAGMKVAGYNIASIVLRFAYVPGSDGLLVHDDNHVALYLAQYQIEPKDPDAVYNDLLTKLSSLYGDIDYTHTNAQYISYTYNVWNGSDGTMVCLEREDYPSGSHYIYIKYSYLGGNDLLETAYQALVYEEALNAVSNIDGL